MSVNDSSKAKDTDENNIFDDNLNGTDVELKHELKQEDLFPQFIQKSLFILTKTSKLRYYCLKIVTSPYPFKKK